MVGTEFFLLLMTSISAEGKCGASLLRTLQGLVRCLGLHVPGTGSWGGQVIFLGTESLLLHDFHMLSGLDAFTSSHLARKLTLCTHLSLNKGENHLLHPSDPNLHGRHFSPFPGGAVPLSGSL